jgi:ribosomal protein S3
MKTEMDEYGGDSQKRSRGFGYEEALAEGKYELRILIPSKSAGAVIGKGGAFIKDIRQKVIVSSNF